MMLDTTRSARDHILGYGDYMDVGVREFKAKLSDYLRRAAEGEDIVVTDRGHPVARLTAYAAGTTFERGVEEGWIEPARRTTLSPAVRHRSPRSVLDILDDDRG